MQCIDTRLHRQSLVKNLAHGLSRCKIEQPKAHYFDELVERSLLTGFRDTAKELGLKQSEFIKILIDKGYIYRTPKGELRPMAQYTNDLFEIKDFKSINSSHAGVRTWITVKGKKVFQLLFGRK